MTPINFTLTELDLKLAAQTGMLRGLRRNWWKAAIAIILISIAISGVIAFFDNVRPSIFLEGFAYLLGIYTVGFIAMLLAIYFWLSGYKARKTMQQMPAIKREQFLSWDESFLHIKAETGESNYPVKDIHKWHAGVRETLVYPADHLYFVFPRHSFPDQQSYDALSALLETSEGTKI